jgi:hypothetical protein
MDTQEKAALRIERRTAEADGQAEIPTPAPDVQAAESPLMALAKSWMRCGPTDRALFLADVRAGCPNLWRTIERDARAR